jgi:PAS domain S-box-containing protein
MQALYAAGRALSSRPGGAEAWQAFADQAAIALHADGVAVFLGRPRDAALDVVATERGPERLLVPSSPSLWEGTVRAHAERNGWPHPAIVPLETGGRVLGHLAAFGKGVAAGDLTAADRQTMETMATQAAAALQGEDLWHETERERAQLRDIVAHSSDGIYTVAADRTVRSWNPAMEAISGWSAADAVGRKCSDLLRAKDEHGADMCSADCPILLAGSSKQEVTRDASVVTRDGDSRLISYAHAPILDDNGTMETDVVVVRDVTRERRTDDAKADFVANISHELRSPLTPIKGFLLTLLREDRWFAEERRREYYRLMLGQAERLEALIEDLLAVTRVEGGTGALVAEPIDTVALVGAAVVRFQTEQPERAIQAGLPEGPVMARGNWLRVEQVLGYLLSNAVRYAPSAEPIQVRLDAGPDEVVINVRDAGPGIPADEQTRIFERFHRGGYYMTREPGGAGLGLYLSKRLIEAMGGHIWVSSKLGEGSTFSFALPRGR